MKHDVRTEGITPSRDLLVIVLGDHWEATRLQSAVARALNERGLDYFVPGAPRTNTLEAKGVNRKPNAFWYSGAVTVSRIHQAKGNEADVVYIAGFDHIAAREADIGYRNQIFVALTRSRGFVQLSGVGEHPLFDEIRRVMAAGERFSFTFTRPPRRDLGDEGTAALGL